MEKTVKADPQEPAPQNTGQKAEPEGPSAGKKRRGYVFRFFRIALILGIVLWVTAFLILFLDVHSFMAATSVCLLYTIVMGLAFFNSRAIFRKEMTGYTKEFHSLENLLLREHSMPYAILDEDGHILWMNTSFQEAIHRDHGYERPVSWVIPVLTRDVFPGDEKQVKVPVELAGNSYIAWMRRVSADYLTGSSQLFGESVSGHVIVLNLVDNTAARLAIQEVDDQSLAIGLFYIDNYDEVIDTVEEVRKVLLIALIDRQVNQYISAIDGICSKIEKDKYLVVLRKKSLSGLKEDHFEILEEVKKVNVGNEMAVTLSMGFGVDGLTYAQNYEFARNAVDLALGRGGDQAVVKSPENVVYYGGKSRQIEKNTRVKARVKAQALKEIILARDVVFIMGHKMGDPDSFGAAVGIYRIARTLEKKAHIIIGERTVSIIQILGLFEDNPEYDKDFIITSAQAMEMVTDNACVVVVDVNTPARTECPELLTNCKSIVVLDHHRAGKDVIEGATLSYVEPYASSACEMVAEIVQYTDDNIRLRAEEADAMYGGIVVDTDSFVNKAGVRTFEAAAFLRRSGADVVRVRKLFREEAVEYKARADAVSQAEIYRKSFAISTCSGEGLRSPTVVGAQAANQLLNIDGIKASFVMTKHNGKIFISARSIDEVNVQVLMEHLGGGGHINMAGSQMDDATEEQAIEAVKKVIDQMIEEGEIEE
ncbi:MAG: DHH family phosphoesterase [Eubacteriales bacterium]|nr:DHH family phosphoesterase [Eubacteriales bacterium]